MAENKSKVLIIGEASNTHFNCKIVDQIRKTKASGSIDFLMFLSGARKGKESYPFERVIFFEKSSNPIALIRLFLKVRKYDTIFFNSLFYSDGIFLLLVAASLGKKTGWVIWGGDLYRTHTNLRKIGFKFLNLSYLAVSIPQDLKKFHEVFDKFRGEVIRFWFPASVNNLPESKIYDADKDYYRVLIGNSATETNRHIQAFDKLLNHKNQKFSLVLPLAYGDESYKKNVIYQAVQRFGEERVEVIDNFMPGDYYAALIKSVDVVFFNHNRQQGGQNLLLAAALGVPIVLSEENIFYDFLSSEGIEVNSVDDFDDVGKVPTPSMESISAARIIVSEEYSKDILANFADKVTNS